jgi:transportin-3
VIEDFFHLIEDALIHYHDQFVPSAICTPIFTAATSALVLEQEHPISRTLRYLEDLLSYGTDHPHSSQFTASSSAAAAKNKSSIRELVSSQGETLVQRVLTGMMFTFPRDCLQDASSVLLTLFELDATRTAGWIERTLQMLPAGSIKPGELEKLLGAVNEKLQTGQTNKIRAVFQDFTTSYRRRHVAPREGLGRLQE